MNANFKQTDIGLIPEDWEEKKFKDYIVLQRGKDLPKYKFEEGKIPVAGSNGIIGFHSEGFVNAPGLTVGRSGSCGAVIFYDINFWAHNTVLYAKEFKGNFPRFVFYHLQFLDLSRFKSGVSVPTLNRNVFSGLNVAIPEINEQKNIAHVLSKIQQAIETQEQIIKTTQELKKALVQKLFTEGLNGEQQKQTEIGLIPESWEVINLSELFECEDSRRIPIKKSERKTGPYPYYGASGIVDYIDEYIFSGKHLLVAEDGENLDSRKLPIAFIATGNFWVNNHAHILSSTKVVLEFYEEYISEMKINDYLTGTTRPKLNKSMLLAVKLPFPSYSEQEKIVRCLTTLKEKLINESNKHIMLNNFFNSVLNQLMTGQIRVKDIEFKLEESLEKVPSREGI